MYAAHSVLGVAIGGEDYKPAITLENVQDGQNNSMVAWVVWGPGAHLGATNNATKRPHRSRTLPQKRAQGGAFCDGGAIASRRRVASQAAN